MAGQHFRVNTPLVANQVIDGEAVIIHFETGCYYSADKLGAVLFSRLDNGADVDLLIDELCEKFDTPRDEIVASVQAFINKLVAESLIVPTDTIEPCEPLAPIDLSKFAPPALQKYSDLQDLLLLDPIHDIEQEGWPVANPKNEN